MAKRLYGVVIVGIDVIRDDKLKILFDEKDDTIHQGELLASLNKTYNSLSGTTIEYGRIYKTLSGANRFYKEVNNILSYQPNLSFWTPMENKFDKTKHKIVVADITDNWNRMIDEKIEYEKSRHLHAIERLENKYIK